MPNRLAESTSPYLQQHADNPVDWQEWGPDALAEAVRRDVPIFLSIGYAACHWCHVMANESFSDEGTAAMINADFVAIKVDREERPDLDAVYMDATVGLTGQGGWPMSVWLTPEGLPFHAGTYFPPEPRHGMPSFPQVLTAVTEAWQQRRDEVNAGAADIAAQLAARRVGLPPGDVSADDIDRAIGLLSTDFDAVRGGFGGAPKFPPSMIMTALVSAAGAGGPAGESAWQMASSTLAAMARGGLYDQLAGGFARYSTDSGWVVPHFEKMLYDNALLLPAYLRAGREADRRGEDPKPYDRVVTETIDWLATELRTEQGAFASALDADSLDDHGHHAEGAAYVWTPDQLTAALGPEDGPWLASALSITADGTFEHGTSVAQRLDEPEDLDRFDTLCATLLEVRRQRPAPVRDDKVVTAWNGWLIAALAEAGMVLEHSAWVELARTAAEHVWQVHRVDGRLRRTSRDGRASSALAVAEDHAALAHGFDVLAQATGDPAWLERAEQLLIMLDDRFATPEGGLYDTADDAEQLYARPRDLTENATPSGTTAALIAYRLHARLTGDQHWTERADGLAASTAELLRRAPRAAGWPLLDAITEHGERAPVEVAVLGEGSAADELTRTAWRHAPAGSTIIGVAEPVPGFGVLEGKTAIDGRATAYVCRHFTCQRPVHTVTELIAQLA